MKTMTYFSAICILLLASCSKEVPVESEELVAINLRYAPEQEAEKLNGLSLYQVDAQIKLAKIDKLISELEEAIASGRKDLSSKLKSAQGKKEDFIEYEYDLYAFRAPGGGRFPPRPPKGCWMDPKAGCIPKINLVGVKGIEIPEGTAVRSVEIKDEKNRVVGSGGTLRFERGGGRVMELNADFRGEATMHITTTFEGIFGNREVITEIPVTMD